MRMIRSMLHCGRATLHLLTRDITFVRSGLSTPNDEQREAIRRAKLAEGAKGV